MRSSGSGRPLVRSLDRSSAIDDFMELDDPPAGGEFDRLTGCDCKAERLVRLVKREALGGRRVGIFRRRFEGLFLPLITAAKSPDSVLARGSSSIVFV